MNILFFYLKKFKYFGFFNSTKSLLEVIKKKKTKTNNLKFKNKFFLIRKTEKINALLVFYCKKFAIKFRLFFFFFLLFNA